MKFRAFGIAAVLSASVSLAFVPPVAAAAASDQTMPSCAAGDPVVWENSSSKVYHLKGDKYFGTTKSGAYACKSAADGAGYHASKSKASSKSAGSSTASPAPDAMTSPSASGSPMAKHHRHKKGATASPAPGESSSPDAMGSPSADASPMGKHHRHKKGAMPGASASPAPAAT